MNCMYCNKEYNKKNALIQHQIRCSQNPNAIPTSKGKKWTDEQKKKWSLKCKETNCNYGNWSTERRLEASKRRKDFNNHYWTEDNKKKQSKRMKNVVIHNPNSYSKNNVSGRVKMYEVQSSTGICKVKGTWELKVATWLNENNIKWTNTIKPYSYFWNKDWHLYFPDFLLLDTDILIEVKGYETERDKEKWKSVDKKLIIIRKEELTKLESILCKEIK